MSRGRDLLLPWFSPAPSFWLLSSSFSCMVYTVEGTADSSSQTHSYSSVTKNEWELSSAVNLMNCQGRTLSRLSSWSKGIFAKGRSLVPVALGYSALILSPPEIYAWRVGRAVPQGDRNTSLCRKNPCINDKRCSDTTLLYPPQRSRKENGFLSDFPRFMYRLLPHFLLPPQTCGSSQGLESLPKTFTHLHLVVILTTRSSNELEVPRIVQ